MIRIPLVNPLMVLLAQRVRRELPCPADSPWQGLDGLRREAMDPDRRLNHWTEAWPVATQNSLDEALLHPLLRVRPERMGTTQPLDLARVLAENPKVPPEGRQVGDACLLPWGIQGRRYAPALVDRAIQAKAQGHQVWWVVKPEDALAAAQESLVQDGLRLGTAWFLLPAATEAFEKALRAWTQRIVNNPRHDQWVWPWAELTERAMGEMAQNGAISRKNTAPPGWSKDSAARWSLGARAVVDAWREAWNGPGLIEDLWMGLLHSGGATPALAERK
jgi:hypothetical protein